MSEFRAKVLVVDNELSNTTALKKILEQEAYSVSVAHSGQDALNSYRAKGADIIITDLRMPGMSGLELLKAIRILNADIPVVLLTAFGTVDDAVEAMKLGAIDFLMKPITRSSVLRSIQDCLSRIISESQQINSEPIIGSSAAMIHLKKTIRVVAPTKASVMILGESGTGKEIIAKSLHKESGVSGQLISINCAAIPESLLESELFGYERGAFTGAIGAKKGLFEAANKGTLFLDEIGEMPLSLQTKILRLLEDGTYFRLGSVEPRHADVRVIAATNANMLDKIRMGLFREDLWYRLNVIHLLVPPLRARGEDILVLAEHYLKLSSKKYKKEHLKFSPRAKEIMLRYSWPGNVRELINVIERSVVMTQGEEVDDDTLNLTLIANNSILEHKNETLYSQRDIRFSLGTSLKEIENKVIRETLQAMDGDKALTAKVLGVNLRTIYRKLQYPPN